MKDLCLAKRELEEGDYSLVFVKEGKVVLRSRERGIKELYSIVKGDRDYSGAAVADKVVGKGAAILYDIIGVERLHGLVVSNPALLFLEDKNLDLSYELRIDIIKNRTGDDLCPIEKLSIDSLGGSDFVETLDSFFKNI